MSSTSPLRFAIALALAAGCKSSGTSGPTALPMCSGPTFYTPDAGMRPDGAPEPCPQVSDEAQSNIDGADERAMADDARAPVVSSPAEGQALPPSGPAPVFAWSAPPQAQASVAPPSGSGCRIAWWKRVLGALAPERIAWAHCPTTGNAYIAKVIDGDACVLEHATGHTSWALSEDEWTTLKSHASHTLEIEVTWAYVSMNVIQEGPTRASAFTHFSVSP